MPKEKAEFKKKLIDVTNKTFKSLAQYGRKTAAKKGFTTYQLSKKRCP
jgi:hypothetical protein